MFESCDHSDVYVCTLLPSSASKYLGAREERQIRALQPDMQWIRRTISFCKFHTHPHTQTHVPDTQFMDTPSSERKTDSLLQPGRGNAPSHGINDDEEEEKVENEDEKKLVNVAVNHSNDRVWTVAVFSLIVCLGSVVVGMMLGYSTNTLAELSSGDTVYAVTKGSTEASLFGVSLSNLLLIIPNCPCDQLVV